MLQEQGDIWRDIQISTKEWSKCMNLSETSLLWGLLLSSLALVKWSAPSSHPVLLSVSFEAFQGWCFLCVCWDVSLLIGKCGLRFFFKKAYRKNPIHMRGACFLLCLWLQCCSSQSHIFLPFRCAVDVVNLSNHLAPHQIPGLEVGKASLNHEGNRCI